jgi:hypothetical protein
MRRKFYITSFILQLFLYLKYESKNQAKEKATTDNDGGNKKGCGWWYLVEHFHNNLMKLGGSLGNVPQKMKNFL